MNLRSLLLGSIAAIVAAGGAQAADLTVAEPVDYVKVCSTFGSGFYYSPGTDSCIKIGGYVEFGTSFGDTDFGFYNEQYPNSRWDNFYTEASIQLTAATATEYGNLVGFIDVRAQTGNSGGFEESLAQVVNSTSNTAYVDSAYLELGPVKAGYFTSLFDFGRGYTDTGAFGSDTTTDHIQFTYAANGFGLALSIEDQRDRGAAGSVEATPGAIGYGGQDNIPDIVAAATYSSGLVNAKIAGAYVNHAVDRVGAGTTADPFVYSGQSGWAVGGGVEVKLDGISPGDRFFASAAYGDNANSFTGIAGGTSVAGLSSALLGTTAEAIPGNSWSALASYKHVWSPQIWSAVSGGYASFDGSGQWYGSSSFDAWRAVFSTGYTPVKGLDLMFDSSYSSVDHTENAQSGDAWALNLWMKRSW
ncbi:porin [Kaistia dalseonensis]|uniref:Porin n=1 Tax=Kaistia dalseonensis TaxID=410840 RepID=A0ABU0H1D8_9HYPH|nr:porin [Kaistia dalseonensis]MCX5493569.1 porin [Kaistia dalseonensis]MDQ0436129.1 hypothetical protein [Kaistia dalseonensis]